MAAKLIVLRRIDGPGGRWEQHGAVVVDVEVGVEGWTPDVLDLAQTLAVEAQAGQGGVYVAVPFEFWRLFEGEVTVKVRPVPTAADMVVAEAVDAGLVEGPSMAVEDDPDLEGLTQGPRR